MTDKPTVLGIDGAPAINAVAWKPDPAQRVRFTPAGKLMNVQIVFSDDKAKVAKIRNGIIMPDAVKIFTPVCYVLAVGPKCEQVKAGQFIYVSISVTIHELNFPDDTSSHVVHEDGVFGVLTDEEVKNVLELTGWVPPGQQPPPPPCCRKDTPADSDLG